MLELFVEDMLTVLCVRGQGAGSTHVFILS